MKHFKMSEFEKSLTAKKLGVNNSIPTHFKKNVEALVDNVLDPLREMLDMPILITSGYRHWRVNEAVGGAANSQHLSAQACDFSVVGMHPMRVVDIALDSLELLEFDQWIVYSTFTHVSYVSPERNRNEVIIKVRNS